MNRKRLLIFFTLLCLTALAACSSGTATSTGIPVTGNDNSSVTAVPESEPDNDNSSVTSVPESEPEDNGNSSATQSPEAGATTTTGMMTKVNLNTATEDELLAAVPGLGERMVDEFLEYRPYVSIQQFRQEMGKYVDEAQVSEYENYVFVPISINDSDAATLQQIPGLDANEAEALIAARPFASMDDFLNQLSSNVSESELEVASAYLEDN